jgi:hypothetical protein
MKSIIRNVNKITFYKNNKYNNIYYKHYLYSYFYYTYQEYGLHNKKDSCYFQDKRHSYYIRHHYFINYYFNDRFIYL